MKKLSFLMIMTLVLGLTACGKADNNADKKDDVTTEVKEEDIEADDKDSLVDEDKIYKD